MEAYRIDISSWTASFRYPNIISGIQPTLEVPPLSTVLGLMNAAAGRYIEHTELDIGYFFRYEGTGEDLETIYQIKSVKDSKTKRFKKDQYGNVVVANKNITSNIVLRHFLFNCELSIYLTDKKLADYFRKPFYPLVLGRSNDLATIEKVTKINLEHKPSSNHLKGQIVPMKKGFLPGQIQALPKYFSNTIPRQSLGTEPFSIISHNLPVESDELEVFYDSENDVDIYFHKFQNTSPPF